MELDTEFARSLGHGYVETTPALVPLILGDSVHARAVRHCASRCGDDPVEGPAPVRLEGSMLWTHFGVSGPVILNASRHWLRSRLEGPPRGSRSRRACPGETFASSRVAAANSSGITHATRSYRAGVTPAGGRGRDLDRAGGVDASTTMAHLTRDDRRRLSQALLETRSRFATAAATTTRRSPPAAFRYGNRSRDDGVARASRPLLDRRDPRRRRRIGGFNFQWAWSSAWVAAQAIARRLRA